jgi:hypothetical protein
MALKVKDAATAAAKFVARAQGAGADYSKGVANAGQNWQDKATAAKDSFAAGIQAAIGRDAYTKGIAKAGASRYTDRATNVGAQRYPQGVAGAGPQWQKNTQPYLDSMANLTLPVKRPRGDPGNLARVQAIADNNRALKLRS